MKKDSVLVHETRNPRTGEYDYKLPILNEDELIEECTRLRKGQTKWQSLGVEGRIEVLRKWKTALENRREEIMEAIITDTGRLNESVREYENILKWIERWSEVAKEVFELDKPKNSKYVPILEISQDYSAYPLVGVISPWNFPLSLSVMDMIPALLAGSSVIVKPSEVTPRFIEPLKKSINDVPELAYVLSYVAGAGDVGSAMIDHVDLIVFTGSVSTGRKVAAKAGGNLIPAFLELGGKDPAVVLKSADIEKAVKGILFGSICGMGHQCFSIERIYVDETIHDQFLEQLINEAQKVSLAYPNVEEGQLGPVIFDKQAAIIDEHLHDAVKKGAEIHCGGEIEKKDGGLWIKPTVLSNVNHGMKIMNEETFGPLMPVMSFSSIDEAISLANDTTFGLSASVFSQDEDEAYYVARKINAGGVSINDSGVLPFVITEAPDYTAFKTSGVGASRFGKSGIERFLRKKLIVKKDRNVTSPWWYEV
ncbi:aldehyde dehydrogenase family protein [Bacillus sp. FJAT-29814]|uniref:aldehyde dehydrogenase family protein n=1 Tax=Bacillus sp. FJAT-29814 TaxID=1729688 RepID=UPI000AF35E6D|nr:aldehyde dehydrogenase family protein [Bacillus sp. FJAT-29814]